MKNNFTDKLNIGFSFPIDAVTKLSRFFEKRSIWLIVIALSILSIFYYNLYLDNGLGLAYNDARSHLDIGRRVVEGLKTGIAQLGSVWLPLNHILMIPLIWNDYLWHTGFAGAVWSMISFVATGVLIYKFLDKLNVSVLAKYTAVAVFAANINILYLQSTAMTELLLMATMMAGVYYLMLWAKTDKIYDLVKSAFWIMASTMVRYDGWFLLAFATLLIAYLTLRNGGYKKTEGIVILFATMGGFGIALWFLWNLLIFNDPLYFMFGPFSAHAQQLQLEEAGNLQSKGNLLLSTRIYFLALFYNSYTLPAILGFLGAIFLAVDKTIKSKVRVASAALMAPLFFNILALFLGFSVLFVQGVSGNTWFNVRYGTMLAPSFAIYIGYIVHRVKNLKFVIIGLLTFVTFFAFANQDAVTIDDAKFGSSQKNVTEVAGWLYVNTRNKEGFTLISVASHDAIIFSSRLPMKRFIHEGTGKYWEEAIEDPSRWAKWIVVRTNDDTDFTWREIKDSEGLKKFDLVEHYPFADIYVLKPEYWDSVNTTELYKNQK